MSRAERRHAVGAGAGSIADDLLLIRAAGGFAEASAPQLQGTLDVLGLDHPTDSEVDHACDALRELTRVAIAGVKGEYPIQETDGSQTASGSRDRQPWQAVAADSLERMLLPSNGTKGMIVDIRSGVSEDLGNDSGTVKRYEDKLIDVVLAPNIHNRLTADGPARRRARPNHPAKPDPAGDPLWPHLGATESELAEALLRNARMPGNGFDAQEYGMAEPSRASTGMVTYALAMTSSIDDATIAELYDEILNWITPGGVLPRRHGSDVESTWTESQCLLALTARPHLLDGDPGPFRLADSLLRQQEDGGWSYRSGGNAGPHPLWSFYPLLALSRASKAGWVFGPRYREAANRSAEHVASALEAAESTVDLLLGLSVLRLATAGTDSNPWSTALEHHTERLVNEASPAEIERLTHFTITDERQPLWYARVNPALLYLHARRVLGAAHDITHALAGRLLDEYDRLHQGWTNSTRLTSKPYTWTTAIALRSCQLIRHDVRGGAMPWPHGPSAAVVPEAG